MDQCMHCTKRGDFEGCQATTCNLHESWMVKKLKEHNKALMMVTNQAIADELNEMADWFSKNTYADVVMVLKKRADGYKELNK